MDKKTITIRMAEQKFTAEQIAQLAPNYKGKPEKFDPSKLKGKRASRTLQQMGKAPDATPDRKGDYAKTERKQITLPKPTLKESEQKPTAQRNETLIAEAIFAPNVSVVPVEPRQTFQENYAALPQLAFLMYREYAKDVKLIDRELIKEELSYYSVAILWLRLINIKSKQGLQELTAAEKTLLKDLKDEVYNVPQPLHIYIMSIGAIVDKMRKRTFLEVPTLPVATAGGHGEYHAHQVDAETHVLFEEVPSLGVSGDMVMASAMVDDEPKPNFGVTFPENATHSNNFTGVFPTIGPRRAEIRQRLASYGITKEKFTEYAKDTRYNRQYVKAISDKIGTWDTFKVEKVSFSNSTSDGQSVQAITSKPIRDEPSDNWLARTVQNFSPEDDSAAIFGAATVYLFQLHKTANKTGTTTQRNANWCCATAAAGKVW